MGQSVSLVSADGSLALDVESDEVDGVKSSFFVAKQEVAVQKNEACIFL